MVWTVGTSAAGLCAILCSPLVLHSSMCVLGGLCAWQFGMTNTRSLLMGGVCLPLGLRVWLYEHFLLCCLCVGTTCWLLACVVLFPACLRVCVWGACEREVMGPVGPAKCMLFVWRLQGLYRHVACIDVH